jgi:uncharacterized protein (DUF427 family)
MSLTTGTGPFGPQPAGTFNFTRAGPAHALYLEPYPRRVRAELAGRTVLDSSRVQLLHETGLHPVYYVPLSDFDGSLLEATDHTTQCPFKGDARYWSIRVGDRIAENAVWSYPEPLVGCPPIAGLAACYWDRLDAWFEEDEQVFVHARNPYTRIDVLPSSRRVRVEANGVALADSTRPLVLFETGLPPRYYLPADDVRTDLLEPSDTVTRCPYKGVASHLSFRGHDVAWCYTEPYPQVAPIAGRLAFYPDRVTVTVTDPAP